ncbi:MAG: 2-oxoglutarate dehydrogenase, E2 component, dihydrolipoamide succinyltransferase [Nocardioidaceae bacterium]
MIGDEGEGGGSAQAEEAPAEEAPAQEAPAQEAPAEEPQAQAEEAPAEEAPAEQPAAQEQPAQEQPAQEAPAAQEQQPAASGGTPITLPALGESVTEGTVTRWLKSVGDDVAVDEPLLEVSTDKVDTEIPSPVAGTLLEIKVNEDETVEVGAELAVIGAAGSSPAPAPTQDAAPEDSTERQEEARPEEIPAEETTAQTQQPEAVEQPAVAETPQEKAPEAPAEPESRPAPAPAAPAPAAQAPAAPAASSDNGGYVTPLVRKMAAEHGVDLADITGSGVGGRIRKQDVLDAAERAKQAASAPAPAASAPAASGGTPAPAAVSPLRGKTEKMSRLRKVIATRMVESLQTSAQLTTVVEVDVTSISRLRDAVKAEFAAREGVKLSFMPFFAKATIDALKEHPSLNASIDTEAGEVTYYDRENVAIAVDTEKGLLTPVVKDAGDLSIAGLARKIADLADRTRNNKIGPDELSGGTFTLTNTGSRGALFDTPIINQPQVAILGTGSVVKRAVVIDDPNLGETIAVRQMVYLALTYDHRLVDGADAARFLSDVKARLETGKFEV